MADPIYGLHQSQPIDVYNYMKGNARKLGLVGQFSYLPALLVAVNAPGTFGLSLGTELIVSDKIQYEEEYLMDGRIRRYAKIRMYLADFGPGRLLEESQDVIEKIRGEMNRLGYSETETVQTYVDPVGYSTEIGVDAGDLGGNIFSYAEAFDVIAGAPTYRNEDENIVDAPRDGSRYLRFNGEWVVEPVVSTADINGGDAV